MTLRVLIVDDEPLAREGVALKLRREADVEIAGECENAEQAVRDISARHPDLVFLDIKLPGQSGFDVIRRIGIERMPLVIFLTAYDEHAVAAFEHNALDYLLKPIDPARFRQSLDKARRYLERERLAGYGARLGGLLERLDAPAPAPAEESPAQRLLVKSGGRVYFLKPGDIDWIEAEGDYVNIHGASGTLLLRETLRSLEDKLAGQPFARVHRSAIVNLDKVRELVATGGGEQELRLHDGTALRLGRQYREALYRRLNLDVPPEQNGRS